jgi:hypothetical protein
MINVTIRLESNIGRKEEYSDKDEVIRERDHIPCGGTIFWHYSLESSDFIDRHYLESAIIIID